MLIEHFYLNTLLNSSPPLCFPTANDNSSGLCQLESALITSPPNPSCSRQESPAQRVVYPLLLLGQLLLGIGAVPIQPFGISYIDDYASKKNSPLYLGTTHQKTLNHVSSTVRIWLKSQSINFPTNLSTFQKDAGDITFTLCVFSGLCDNIHHIFASYESRPAPTSSLFWCPYTKKTQTYIKAPREAVLIKRRWWSEYCCCFISALRAQNQRKQCHLHTGPNSFSGLLDEH